MRLLTDMAGHGYSLQVMESILRPAGELVWLCDGERVTLRDVIGRLEAYEPARSMTAAALAEWQGTLVSTSVARAELTRVLLSEIVLNRGLREAVLASRLSLSEIAMGCGRMKRDPRGNRSGETSWVSRRVGILPEGGQSAPSPWVHTDVLALIARQGLGCEPRDCEVDVQEDVEIEEHWCSTCREQVTTGPDGVCPWCETATRRARRVVVAALDRVAA